jgi:hypothetical protein
MLRLGIEPGVLSAIVGIKPTISGRNIPMGQKIYLSFRVNPGPQGPENIPLFVNPLFSVGSKVKIVNLVEEFMVINRKSQKITGTGQFNGGICPYGIFRF